MTFLNKKISLLILVVIFLSLISAVPFAAQYAGAESIDVVLQIPISGETKIPICKSSGGTGLLECGGIATYIGIVYQWGVAFAAVLAVLAFTYAGVLWTIAGGDAGKVTESKKVMGSALVGLLLALGSYMILNVINPNLVAFKPLGVKPITKISLSALDIDLGRTGGKDGGFTNTCIDDYHNLNPDIKYSATAEDVFSQVATRFGKCYWTKMGERVITDHLATLVHENVHKLNGGANTIYLGGGRYVSPSDAFYGSSTITQTSVGAWVPSIFKTDNAILDYVTKKEFSENPPFVLLDEFSAYVLDAEAGFEVAEKKKTVVDFMQVDGTLLMMINNLSLALMIDAKEPTYLAGHDGLVYKNLLRELIERTIKLYNKGLLEHDSESKSHSKATYNKLRNDHGAKALHNIMKKMFNTPATPNWTRDTLGF